MKVLLPENEYNCSADSEPRVPSIEDLTRVLETEEIQFHHFANLTRNVINSFIILICLGGFMGNGAVIWLLGFRIKRNPYTTYILNLSVADFGVLIFLTVAAILSSVDVLYRVHVFFILGLLFSTYTTSQFLLTTISIDRCVAVLFPLWHRCHRPPCLSPIVCALIWILSFLLSGIHITLHLTGIFPFAPFQLLVNVVLCAPIMLISTLTLFIKVYCKAKQHRQRKLVTAILHALFFFLIFGFPPNILCLINVYHGAFAEKLLIGCACASLNSSVNPLIYFLVGKRQKKSNARVSIKVALRSVFEDEQECEGEETPKGATLL